MLKLIFILASLFVVGVLIAQDYWMISIIGFGYEIRLSTVLLLSAVLLLWYVLHLLKKPLVWMGGIRHKITTAQYAKREAYLEKVMIAYLSGDTVQMDAVLKQGKSLFGKNEPVHQVIAALLQPSLAVFEDLEKREQTELAAYHGLYTIAAQEGNLKAQEHLLEKALRKYPNVHWVIRSCFQVQLLQNDWTGALQTLESLKKHRLISSADYVAGKAGLLYKTGCPAEAFRLDHANPKFALAAAQEQPRKACDIYLTVWKQTPTRAIYEAYRDLFADQSAVKQMKAVKKLAACNPGSRQSLLAQADMAIRLQMWQEAKETLQIYLASYPLTRQAAQMMAHIAREGWHHSSEAKEWENKAVEAADCAGWYCTKCGLTSVDWDILCPHCNGFNTIFHR